MIECTKCRLPALPLVLFWERLLSLRMACVCGCIDRAVQVGNAVTAAPDFDIISQMRASEEGMPEQGTPARRIPYTSSLPVPVSQFKQWMSPSSANTDRGDGSNPFRSPLLKKYNSESAKKNVGEFEENGATKEVVQYLPGWTAVVR